MFPTVTRTAKMAAAVVAGLAGLALAGPALASASDGSGPATDQFQVQPILNGKSLSHTYMSTLTMMPATENLANPDDLTRMGRDLFVGFQNGVGPQGQASASGNPDSTIVEFTADGTVLNQWELLGKCDGLTADPQRGELIATVNEDANSSIYTISPFGSAGDQVHHYTYNEPLPHLGGTDAISIYRGQVFVSASAPGTTGTPVTSPAVYSVSFDPSTLIATVTPVFNDTDQAATANVGSEFGTVSALALTDPDSSEVVPFLAPRFGGSFMLDSQGDDEQIFLGSSSGGDDQGNASPSLSVLSLNTSVDDSAWATNFSGFLVGSYSGADTVDMVTGPFRPGTMFVAATPCSDNNAPASCPAPPKYPANFLGTENMWTGAISPVTVTGAAFQPNSLIFVRG